MTQLIHGIEVVGVRGDPASAEVRSVEFDSRTVQPGSLFCCVPGGQTDGHLHADEAVRRGATALLCERTLELDVTQVVVPAGQVRPAMAEVAATFHGHPSRAMSMVGVTGTNGKTTVTELVRTVLDHADISTGVIGTLFGARTTPEAPALQRVLAEFRDDGRGAVAMEVSSHALTQHRVDGIVFDVAAFTNLSRDHLDHHGSMDQYFAAKARLFERTRARSAVINVDAAWGRRLAEVLDAYPVVPVRRSEATDIEVELGRSSFRWRGLSITLPLTGAFNVDNALMAATVATQLGIDDAVVAEGLSRAPVVPGRMEVVSSGEPVSMIVDYAHTPGGLEVALTAARALAGTARVVCLFGCGGDRDQGKRPAMGSVAARLSDVVVLTSDNPRSEEPTAIIDQIRSGVVDPVELQVEPDRAAAIRTAVGLARPGDVVLVAGKGHETTQMIKGRAAPFDDRAEARRVLADRFGMSAP